MNTLDRHEVVQRVRIVKQQKRVQHIAEHNAVQRQRNAGQRGKNATNRYLERGRTHLPLASRRNATTEPSVNPIQPCSERLPVLTVGMCSRSSEINCAFEY